MNTQISAAAACIGSVPQLARAIGVTPPTVYQWRDGVRPVPEVRALQIERATKGAVTCEELRPDIDWSRWRDVQAREKEAVERV